MSATSTDIIENDPPEFYLATLNRRIREVMDKTLRTHGLKLVEWRLLSCLEGVTPLTIHDLSQLSAIDRTVTSRLVEKLAETKLVKKITLRQDKRFVQVSLTAKGKDLLAKTSGDVSAVREHLFSRLDPSEIQALTETIQILIENADSIGKMHRHKSIKPHLSGL
jgi:DNA-binding MarR family transcriptional regulator